MKKTTEFHEFEFTAHDIDSATSITDVLLINSNLIHDPFETIQNYIRTKHAITTLSNNTWQLEDFGPTGKIVQKFVEYKIIKKAETNKNYPIQNEI